MISPMAKAFKCILMEADMKENSDLERKKGEESLYGGMGLCTMDNLKMDSYREKEFIIYLMDKLTKVSSERTRDTVEEHTLQLWELTPEAIKEIKKKDRASSLGQMAKCSKELSIMGNLMDKAHY